jgi:hypothetical protein
MIVNKDKTKEDICQFFLCHNIYTDPTMTSYNRAWLKACGIYLAAYLPMNNVFTNSTMEIIKIFCFVSVVLVSTEIYFMTKV